MIHYPIDDEVRARILADHRARRGPFEQGIVAPHELVASYGIGSVKPMHAAAMLRELALREVVPNLDRKRSLCSRLMLFVVDPKFVPMRAIDVLRAYQEARGLPVTS